MPLFTDQLNRTIELAGNPTRIVSVVPSQTELLYDLGLSEEVIGITKFCIHPDEWFRNRQRIGGTKTLNIEKIKALNPDLIIGNKEENLQEHIEQLAKDFPVWISDVNELQDAYRMIASVGEITNTKKKAIDLTDKIKDGFCKLQTPNLKLRTTYLIWKDPYMAAGGYTFINDMMNHAGLQNIFERKDRYPQITIDDIQNANCQLLILSSEPYPFKQKHLDELAAQLPHTKMIIADGEMFSWYGSRLQYAPAYFASLYRQLACIM